MDSRLINSGGGRRLNLLGTPSSSPVGVLLNNVSDVFILLKCHLLQHLLAIIMQFTYPNVNNKCSKWAAGKCINELKGVVSCLPSKGYALCTFCWYRLNRSYLPIYPGREMSQWQLLGNRPKFTTSAELVFSSY